MLIKRTDEWKKSGNDYYVRSNGARAVNQWRTLPNPDADEEDEPEWKASVTDASMWRGVFGESKAV